MSLEASRCLARGLDVLAAYTEAPLRLRDHVSGPECEVFELQEEFELGPPGRRFIVSVRREARADPLPVPPPVPSGSRSAR